MRIAIPVLQNNGRLSQISEHFGHAPFFAFVDVDKEGNWSAQIERNPAAVDHMPGQIPQYLISNNVDVLLVRGIGERALKHFEAAGVKVIRGASGLLQEIISDFLAGKLKDQNYHVKDKFHKNHRSNKEGI